MSGPQDSDPIRYAILASLTDVLVLSLNHKIKHGMRYGIPDKHPMNSELAILNPLWKALLDGIIRQIRSLSQKLRLKPGVETTILGHLMVIPCPLPPINFRPFNILANFVQLYNVVPTSVSDFNAYYS